MNDKRISDNVIWAPFDLIAWRDRVVPCGSDATIPLAARQSYAWAWREQSQLVDCMKRIWKQSILPLSSRANKIKRVGVVCDHSLSQYGIAVDFCDNDYVIQYAPHAVELHSLKCRFDVMPQEISQLYSTGPSLVTSSGCCVANTNYIHRPLSGLNPGYSYEQALRSDLAVVDSQILSMEFATDEYSGRRRILYFDRNGSLHVYIDYRTDSVHSAHATLEDLVDVHLRGMDIFDVLIENGRLGEISSPITRRGDAARAAFSLLCAAESSVVSHRVMHELLDGMVNDAARQSARTILEAIALRLRGGQVHADFVADARNLMADRERSIHRHIAHGMYAIELFRLAKNVADGACPDYPNLLLANNASCLPIYDMVNSEIIRVKNSVDI